MAKRRGGEGSPGIEIEAVGWHLLCVNHHLPPPRAHPPLMRLPAPCRVAAAAVRGYAATLVSTTQNPSPPPTHTYRVAAAAVRGWARTLVGTSSSSW